MTKKRGSLKYIKMMNFNNNYFIRKEFINHKYSITGKIFSPKNILLNHHNKKVVIIEFKQLLKLNKNNK